MEEQVNRLLKSLDQLADGLAVGGNLEASFSIKAAQQTIRTLWFMLNRPAVPSTASPSPCPLPKE